MEWVACATALVRTATGLLKDLCAISLSYLVPSPQEWVVDAFNEDVIGYLGGKNGRKSTVVTRLPSSKDRKWDDWTHVVAKEPLRPGASLRFMLNIPKTQTELRSPIGDPLLHIGVTSASADEKLIESSVHTNNNCDYLFVGDRYMLDTVVVSKGFMRTEYLGAIPYTTNMPQEIAFGIGILPSAAPATFGETLAIWVELQFQSVKKRYYLSSSTPSDSPRRPYIAFYMDDPEKNPNAQNWNIRICSY